MELWRERALVFTNDRLDFWNHFIKQIMHIRQSVVSKIIHPRQLYKIPKHTRLSASCVSDFYKVTSGWIILTNDLSNVHYLYIVISEVFIYKEFHCSLIWY